MTTTTSSAGLRPDAVSSISSIYRALLRSQYKPWRIVGLGGLGALGILLALVVNNTGEFNRQREGTELIAEYGIRIVLPVVAVLVATNVLGNLIEDKLLVYFWMKPIPKWHIAIAAWAACVTVLVPLIVLPMVIMAALVGEGSIIGATLILSLLGAAAYSALFLAMSAQFSRALWIGLIYILVWESLMAGLTTGFARFSIRSYLTSRLSDASGYSLLQDGRASWATIVIPIAVTVAGIAFASWRLQRRDVD